MRVILGSRGVNKVVFGGLIEGGKWSLPLLLAVAFYAALATAGLLGRGTAFQATLSIVGIAALVLGVVLFVFRGLPSLAFSTTVAVDRTAQEVGLKVSRWFVKTSERIVPTSQLKGIAVVFIKPEARTNEGAPETQDSWSVCIEYKDDTFEVLLTDKIKYEALAIASKLVELTGTKLIERR